MKKLAQFIAVFAVCFLFSSDSFAQDTYQKPPKDIMDVLNAMPNPQTSVSPAKDKIMLLEPMIYPSIAELSQPMLRLAGLRINPNTNAAHRQSYATKMTLKNISDGKETVVYLGDSQMLISPQWSADGKYIAVGNVLAGSSNGSGGGVQLWVVETATGKSRLITSMRVNTAFGGFSWMPDQKSLLVNSVPQRGNAPAYQNVTPIAPNIQETNGKGGAIQTFQDLLRSPNDEKLFEYYATSQLEIITVDNSKGAIQIGQPAIFDEARVSPDGKYILTSRIQRPFSYLFPYFRFPKEVEVWDIGGKSVYKVASIPLQDALSIQGVPVGPRSYGWIPTEDATLIWAEALDGGDPKNKITPRDKLMTLAAPFNLQPAELVKIEQRYNGRTFGERDGMMWFYDYDRDKQRRRAYMMSYKNPSQAPKMIFDLNVNDRYGDIGTPVLKTLPNGERVIQQNGDEIFLTGTGASEEGDRPFLRTMDLKTLKIDEIFRSGKDSYESFVAFANNGVKSDRLNFITRSENITMPPNLYLRTEWLVGIGEAASPKQITDFKDTTPQLRGITKKLVKYKRADGVDLSFTLYLPPNYKEGTRLPTVVWAYPLEFTDASTAGQVTGSTNRFTNIGSYSHLFFLLQGYAILDDTTMPVVGDPLTVNDTFIKQIVDSAAAAIDKAVEMGVTDRERVGVGGHSYGAFMTANLLAHSDLFRAGIARSGAYNRTLTPFGFQSERRNFWEATELYTKVSPFFYANKINEPVLLIHGEADNNQGTFPIQSERLFAAISGTGGTARLVMLPLESHGYSAKESTEHVLYEMLNWFDKYVKNAKPREAKQVADK